MMKKIRIITAAIIVILTAFLLASCGSDGAKQDSDPATEAVTEVVTEQPTQPPTEKPTAPAAKAPKEVSAALKAAGKTARDLEKTGCRQLVTVISDGNRAKIGFYRLKDGVWAADEGLSCDGYVGQNGVTDDMREGGLATPRGLYPVDEAFYIFEKPETGLDSFQITEDTYWVDDPDSELYNQRYVGDPEGQFRSAERMYDVQPYYNYGFVIGYNTEAKYNAGSAIFFHYSTGPTMGCVGASEEMTLKYLAALDQKEKPYILIV